LSCPQKATVAAAWGRSEELASKTAAAAKLEAVRKSAPLSYPDTRGTGGRDVSSPNSYLGGW